MHWGFFVDKQLKALGVDFLSIETCSAGVTELRVVDDFEEVSEEVVVWKLCFLQDYH